MPPWHGRGLSGDRGRVTPRQGCARPASTACCCPPRPPDLSVRASVDPTPSSPSIWLPIWETNSKLAQFLTVGEKKTLTNPRSPWLGCGARGAGDAPRPASVCWGCCCPRPSNPKHPVIRWTSLAACSAPVRSPPLSGIRLQGAKLPQFCFGPVGGSDPSCPGGFCLGACPCPVLPLLLSRAVSWEISPATLC